MIIPPNRRLQPTSLRSRVCARLREIVEIVKVVVFSSPLGG
jgi:hypothetical protein